MATEASNPTGKLCGRCGAALPADAPRGICPRCELEGALDLLCGGTATAKSENPPAERLDRFQARQLGDYELLEEIARGGMGIVYKARQVSLDRLVAVKMLLFGPLANPEFVQRFRTEATAAGSLHHPNIVSIHEVGIHQNQHYLVMDFVNGPPLSRLVTSQPLPPKRAAAYVKTIAEAIQYAHARGILHRDLKPSNVLIDEHDQPRVTDFGLAKRLEKDTELTLSGQVLGSPSYMAPEQAAAHRGLVGKRSDVYSLGAILYHLLTGRAPFVAPTVAETLQQVQNVEPVSPTVLNPHLPRDLKTICLKCLEKEPARRYQTAQELADDLGRWLRGEPILARPVSRPEKVWRWCRRKPVVASLSLAVTALLLMLLIGSPIAAWRINRARQLAQAKELQARRIAYASDMNLACQTLKSGSLGHARALLERNRPRSGEEDLRHWEWRYLWDQCQSDALLALPPHSRAIWSLAFSPDGRWLAWGGDYGVVGIWDVAGRREVTQLQGSGKRGATLAFSPRGDRLAAAAQSTGIQLWEVGSWSKTTHLPFANWASSMSFSSDGKLLACFVGTVRIQLWDLETTNRLANVRTASPNLGVHKGRVAISPDNQWLVVGEYNGHIRVLDLATQAERTNITGAAEGITALAFSPDGKVLASGSGYEDYSIKLWNTATWTSAGRLHGHTKWVKSLVFSPDGKILASASADQTVRLWDTLKWEELAVLRGHRHGIWALAFSPDGQHLASGSKDGEIYFWSVPPRPKTARLVTLPEPVRQASFSSDGKTLAVWYRDGTFRLLDPVSLQPIRRLTELGTNNYGVLFSPQERLLAVGDRSGVMQLLDPDRPGEVRTLVGDRSSTNKVRPASFSADGRLLLGQALTDLTRHYTLWSVDSGEVQAHWSFPPLTGFVAALSPDGKCLVTGDWDGTVRFSDAATGREEKRLEAHRDLVSGLAFSRDAKLLVSASEFGDVRLWDLNRREPVAALASPLDAVHGLAISPDGRRLAVGGAGVQAMKLWDLATQQEVATLAGQGVFHTGLQFSPDGNALLSINQAETLHLWRAPSWEEIERQEKAVHP